MEGLRWFVVDGDGKFVLAYLALALFTLWRLRSRPLSDALRLLWAVFIVLVPFLGALAFLLNQPNHAAEAGRSV